MAADSFQVQLKKGVLDLCVLAQLSERDAYAYEIASKLAEAIGMVDTYLVESPSGPARKYYRLTRSGKAAFAAQRKEWREFSVAVDALLGKSQ
jgi:PadR family transcriptional regulator